MNTLQPNWPKPNNIHAICTLKNCLINNNINQFINKYTKNNKNNLFLLEQEHGITILSANKNNIVKATGYISIKGLLKLEFITEKGKSTYYLPELRTT